MSSKPVYCRIKKIDYRQARRALTAGAVFGKVSNGMMIPVRFGNSVAAAKDLVWITTTNPNHEYYLRSS